MKKRNQPPELSMSPSGKIVYHKASNLSVLDMPSLLPQSPSGSKAFKSPNVMSRKNSDLYKLPPGYE